MNRLRLLALSVLFLGLTSCNDGKSLENYFVKKSENPAFIALDLSPSIIRPDPKNMTAAQSEALEKIDKLNILMFRRTDQNLGAYKAEKDSVLQILKSGKYQQLSKMSRGKMGFSINMKGKETDEKTDEFVVNAYTEDTGFAVIRLLGDDMTLNDITSVLSLMQQSDVDMEQLKPLRDMLRQQQP